MRSYRLGIALLLTSIANQACTREHQPVRSAHHVVRELRTAGFPMVTLRSLQVADSTILRSPVALSSGGDLVAVSDVAADSLLLIFEASTHQFVGEVGSQHVNGSFVTPMMVAAPLNASDGFRVFDPIRRLILTIGVGKSATLRHTANVAGASSIIQPLYLPNGSFFSTALRISGRFGLFGPDGVLLAARGPRPPGPDTLAIFVRQHANSARGVISPDHARLAFASRYADKLEIYDTVGHLLATGTRPFKFDPVYAVGVRSGAPALAMVPTSRIGYVDVAADSSHIFALFSGRTIGGNGSQAYYGREVHQYSWDGQLERVIELDNTASAITVTPDERFLYCLTPVPHPTLLRYELKPDKRPQTTASANHRREANSHV